jgi:hypothetical protein
MRMTPYRKRLLVRGLGYGRPFAPSGPVNPCYTVGLVVEDGWAPDPDLDVPGMPGVREFHEPGPLIVGRWTRFRWYRVNGEEVVEWDAGELPAQPDGAYSVPSSPDEEV